MKRIAISRHAKSSWDNLSMLDIDRPLNKRGLRDSPIMANHLLNSGFIPNQIFTSPSLRTKETSQYFIDEYQIDDNNIHIEKKLYLGSEYDYIDTMYGIDNDINCIMMFGHNPGITDIANICSDDLITNVPTSGILILEMKIDKWVEADWNNTTLLTIYAPKTI